MDMFVQEFEDGRDRAEHDDQVFTKSVAPVLNFDAVRALAIDQAVYVWDRRRLIVNGVVQVHLGDRSVVAAAVGLEPGGGAGYVEDCRHRQDGTQLQKRKRQRQLVDRHIQSGLGENPALFGQVRIQLELRKAAPPDRQAPQGPALGRASRRAPPFTPCALARGSDRQR